VELLSNLLPFADVVTLGMFNKEMRHLSIFLVLIFSFFLLDILPAPVNETNGGIKLWYKMETVEIVQRNQIKWNFCAQCQFCVL
jgi:hypothetical protein